MSDELLPIHHLGYRMDLERPYALHEDGLNPYETLKQFRDTFPQFNTQANPADVVRILDQKNQGACQGHALSMVFSICFFLATGRWAAFSRAAGYYLSQRKDGIRGDNGSTLSGGQWVATQHGMCLEQDWPYPSSYDPSEPNGIAYLYKLKMTRPLRTVQEVMDWIDAGLPVQIGLSWNNSCSREIVNDYRPGGGGGHSTTYWLKNSAGNVNNINSWGKAWNGDGIHVWTPSSIAAALRHQWTVMIGYAPDEMSFPNQEEIGL